MKANTNLCYSYADAANWKQLESIVLSGSFRIEDVTGCLSDGEFFIPSQVGLNDLQERLESGELTTDDHVWHRLISAEATDDPPTDLATTAEELKAAFLAAKGNWDVERAVKELGIPE